MFYWEFVNTFRKIAIIAANTIFSIVSINYRLMLCIMLLIIIERLQSSLKPYKLDKNNRIEIKAILAGSSILFCGLIFEEGSKHNYPRFNTMAFFIIIAYNSHFVFEWLYLFVSSLKLKSNKVKAALEMYRQ